MRIRKETELDSEEILLISEVSNALAHPARVKLFKYIFDRNRELAGVCTKELVEHFDYAQATISQHMKVLLESGLVVGKNVNKYTYYYINLGAFSKYLDTVKKFSTRD